jgi:thymidylate synthase (FAD)
MRAELIDFMGSDDRVVDAARVSFDKISANYTPEQNHRLLKYLNDHNHWSPFSHVMITMRETVPIFVARQRFKHMVGFTYNEVSRRYVSDEPTFFTPDSWRKAAENKKQGSSDEVIENPSFPYVDYGSSGSYDIFIEICLAAYNSLLEQGVAPEQARMVLPQSMYTSYYVTGSLAAWARAYKLRIDPHAQKEIQDLAHQWGDIIGNIPELNYSWKALAEDLNKSENSLTSD